MSILRFARYREAPWKNGGGITREVALAPGAGRDGFLWRVSLADVASDGPFSIYPGVDRTILLVEGRGFALHCRSEKDRVDCVQTLDVPLVPFAFSGDWIVDCKLLAGPVRDLNVMTLRGSASATVDPLALREGGAVVERRVREIVLVLVVRGAVSADLDRGPSDDLGPRLMAGDGVLLSDGGSCRAVIRSIGEEEGRAVLIRILAR